MNNKLEEKLLLLRAKRYIDKIHGIENIFISLFNEKEFQWHKEICSNILRNREKPKCKLNLPVKEEEVYSYMRSKIHIGEHYNYYMFFEGIVMFSFNIIDLQCFLSSCYALKRTFDVCVLLLNPMKVIAISEEEYELSFYDKTM
ncbi:MULTISPECIES: hypothetical protein [Photorhabdus]|uniref:Uncharacterized protein n=1 Tax=Photorhabdus khanii subsp. guanajuatensis TaxID=2100166 RepID=A0A4R4JFD7_9GAMM|nr:MULTISPECIES: hypothetical protein [Photorhabdus]MCW7550936.1 hypothetical protein [Photorhabdus aballayi]TDB52827.1 hypothetical protein C5467_15745 [Photorhabdus khanii subsp. guanajuatensis]